MIRLLHLSDPHFGAADAAVADAFLSYAKSNRYDFTVLSGDLTMRARRSELNDASSFIREIPQPLLLIPGNHDVPATNHPLERFFSPFRRYRKWFGNDLEPEYADENFHIVSVNSTRAFGLHADWSDGILSQKQLDDMVGRFLAHGDRGFRILVLHHPLLAPIGRGRAVVKPLPSLLQAIHEAKVDLVLCGHFHRSQLATAGTLEGWKSVVSQAPTVCSTRLQGEPQGFHEIRFSSQRIEITPWRFLGSHFAAMPAACFERNESGWSDCENTTTDEVVSIEPTSTTS